MRSRWFRKLVPDSALNWTNLAPKKIVSLRTLDRILRDIYAPALEQQLQANTGFFQRLQELEMKKWESYSRSKKLRIRIGRGFRRMKARVWFWRISRIR